MTKQTHTAPEEKPSVELLRKRFQMQDEYIESIRKDNVNAGIPSKYLGDLIQWRGPEFMERKRVENFIAKVTSKKTGKFNRIKDLKARELIPADEENENENKIYPYRRLNSLIKYKAASGRIYLQRLESWYGLDANGQEEHRTFNNLDYYCKPRIE